VAAPTFFGVATQPADGGTATEPATLTITPPASMTAGDLVVVFAYNENGANADITISNDGGQTWTTNTTDDEYEKVGTGAAHKLSWCRFNGTWSANPAWAFPAKSGTRGVGVQMLVFRPDVSTKAWFIDALPVWTAFSAPTTPFTVTITGRTPSAADSVTIGRWLSDDDNTWGTLSGTGWSNTSLGAQYRNLGGSDFSTTYAYNLKGAASATNDVSQNQATLGGDAGTVAIVTFYAALATVPIYGSATNINIAEGQTNRDVKAIAATTNINIAEGQTNRDVKTNAAAININLSAAKTEILKAIAASAVNIVSSGSQTKVSRALIASTIVDVSAKAETLRLRDLIAAANNIVSSSATLGLSRGLSAGAINIISAAMNLAALRGLSAAALNISLSSAELEIAALTLVDLHGASINAIITLGELARTVKLDGAAVNIVAAFGEIGISKSLTAAAVNIVIANSELDVISLNIVNIDGSSTNVFGASATLSVLAALSSLSNNSNAALAFLGALRGLDSEFINTSQGSSFIALLRDIVAIGNNIVIGDGELAVVSLNIVNIDGSSTNVSGANATLSVLMALSSLSNNSNATLAFLGALRGLDSEVLNTSQGSSFIALLRDIAADGNNVAIGDGELGRSIKISAVMNNIVIANTELGTTATLPVTGAIHRILDAGLYVSTLDDGNLYAVQGVDNELYSNQPEDALS